MQNNANHKSSTSLSQLPRGIGASLRHVREVSPGAMGELHGIDNSFGPDHVGDVGDRGAWGVLWGSLAPRLRKVQP